MSISVISHPTTISSPRFDGLDKSPRSCKIFEECKSTSTTHIDDEDRVSSSNWKFTASPRLLKFPIQEFDSEDSNLSKRDSGTPLELLMSIFHTSIRNSKKKPAPSTLRDQKTCKTNSLFSSPISTPVLTQTQLSQGIISLLSGILDVCKLTSSKKNFHSDFKLLVKQLGKSLQACHHQAEKVSQPQKADNPISVDNIDRTHLVIDSPRPLCMIVNYHKALSDQIFDFSHLLKERTTLADLNLVFVNMNEENLHTILSSIGINSLVSIFEFYSFDSLAKTFLKTKKTFTPESEKQALYKSKFIKNFKRKVLASLNALTMDLDLYSRYLSIIVAVAKLHLDLSNLFLSVLRENKENQPQLNSFQQFFEQTLECEVHCAQLFLNDLWDKYTDKVDPSYLDSVRRGET